MSKDPRSSSRSCCRHIHGLASICAVFVTLGSASGNAQPSQPLPMDQPQQPAPSLAQQPDLASPPQGPQPVAPAVPAMLSSPSPLPGPTEPLSAPSHAPAAPRFAIGVNLMQPAIYSLASSFFSNSYFIPVPIEGHVSINPRWGLATTLVYLKHKDGDYKVNGLQLGLGPRLTLVGEGLRGLYTTFKVGLGFRAGHDYRGADYYRIDLTLQPEIGYSLAWGPPGCFLAFGLGVQLQKPLSETSHSSSGSDWYSGWDWNGLGKMINYYLPVVNITLGYGG